MIFVPEAGMEDNRAYYLVTILPTVKNIDVNILFLTLCVLSEFALALIAGIAFVIATLVILIGIIFIRR